MRIYKTWSEALDPKQLASVVSELQQGALMVWPTDTLYAVACSALDVKAIERLCRLKNINPEKTNLSIVCADISQAARYARIDNRDFAMLRQNTPGPFTFLFRAASTLPRAFKGRKIVGVRIPALEKDTVMKVFYIRDLGTYANWQATKSTGDFDARTFEVKMRPSRPIDGLRPGMSVLLKE